MSVLLATVFSNLFLGQASADAKTKKKVTSIAVMLQGKNITGKIVTIETGKTVNLTIKTNPAKAKHSAKFSTSNKNIATVDEKGTVKAKKAGTVKIKVTITGKYRKKSAWIKMKVRDMEQQADSSSDTQQSIPSTSEEPSDMTEPSTTKVPDLSITEPSVTETPVQSSDKKILIAYFSRTGENYGVGMIEKGNTAMIANMIAEQTGGTEFEIVTINSYPEAYSECTDVAKQEKEQNARPELKDSLPALDNYDTIFIGYPIWWSDMPMAVYTFLESYDWHGKTVIPFCTHAGSGLSGTQASIREVCEGAELKPGLAITGTVAQNNQESAKDSVTEWLNSLGYQ